MLDFFEEQVACIHMTYTNAYAYVCMYVRVCMHACEISLILFECCVSIVMCILVFEQAHQDPLMRTSLKAPMERPGPKFYVKRQNNIEAFLYTYIM